MLRRFTKVHDCGYNNDLSGCLTGWLQVVNLNQVKLSKEFAQSNFFYIYLFIYSVSYFRILLVLSFLVVRRGKGKGVPRTGHEGPEGEKMYSSTLPANSALDGGGLSTPRSSRFTPGRNPVCIV